MIRRRINLRFFKGGTTTTTVNKRAEKTAEQKALDTQVYGLMQGIGNRYGGGTIASYDKDSATASSGKGGVSGGTITSGDNVINSTGKGGTSRSNNSYGLGNLINDNLDAADLAAKTAHENTQNILNTNEGYRTQQANTLANANSLAQNSTNYMNSANSALQRSETAGNADYDQAASINAQLANYLAQHGTDATKYTEQLADLTNNANTNQALKNYMAGVYGSINENLNTQASNALANAAARGIINSSTSNKAISDLERNAQNTAASQFSTGFGNLSTNYNNLINAANSNLSNMSSAYGTASNAARELGAQRVADLQKAASGYSDLAGTNNNTMQNLVNVANGYGDLYNEGLTGLEKYASLPSTLYENALSPYSAVYDAWKQMNDDYYGHEDTDTVVSSGGK